MHRATPSYTGSFPGMPTPFWAAGPVAAGHCRRCGEPSGSCCCGCRECRREAKELLATAQSDQGTNQPGDGVSATGSTGSPIGIVVGRGGTTEAFIGGGCCVSLSVEYAPQTPTSTFSVEVGVTDSEGTTMIWRRSEAAGVGYRVREGIITTRPGARLIVLAQNCTARVRWCEVFSC